MLTAVVWAGTVLRLEGPVGSDTERAAFVGGGDHNDIVRKGLAGTAGGDYKMEVLSNGQALCRFRGTNAGTVQGGTNLGTGTHVVRCVKTSSSVRLIIDGVTKIAKIVKVGSISNAQPVILAAKPGDDFTKGFIDYFTIA